MTTVTGFYLQLHECILGRMPYESGLIAVLMRIILDRKTFVIRSECN